MSSQLQIICPECLDPFLVERPETEVASTRCPGCGHSFVFRVPKETPKAAPSAAKSLTDVDLQQLPDLTSVPPAYQVPSHHRRKSPSRPIPVLPIAVFLGCILFIGLGSFAVWRWVRLPTELIDSFAIYDTPRSLLREANEQDLVVHKLLKSMSESSAPDDIEKLVQVQRDSRKLYYRVAQIEPLSSEQADDLFDPDNGEMDPVLGVVGDSQRNEMVRWIGELPQGDRGRVRVLIGSSFAATDFLREYLHHGHLEPPRPVMETEKIDAKRLEILRELNGQIAAVTEKIFSRDVSKETTELEAKNKLRALMGPLHTHLKDASTQLEQLAKQRYELKDKDIGRKDGCKELVLYAEMLRDRVMLNPLVVQASDSELMDAMMRVRMAEDDYELARRGSMPRHLAILKDQEQKTKQRRERLESERQARLAARERDPAVTPFRSPTERASDSSQPWDSDSNSFSRPGGQVRWRDYFSSTDQGMPEGMGRGPRGRRSGYDQAEFESIVPEGEGVTITMKDVRQKTVQYFLDRFRDMQTGMTANITNRRLTLRIAYDGPIQDIVKRIDFGIVTFVDEEARTITVVRR